MSSHMMVSNGADETVKVTAAIVQHPPVRPVLA
jgi:hypothetical protein